MDPLASSLGSEGDVITSQLLHQPDYQRETTQTDLATCFFPVLSEPPLPPPLPPLCTQVFSLSGGLGGMMSKRFQPQSLSKGLR